MPKAEGGLARDVIIASWWRGSFSVIATEWRAVIYLSASARGRLHLMANPGRYANNVSRR
jgi:hypothetical protein